MLRCEIMSTNNNNIARTTWRAFILSQSVKIFVLLIMTILILVIIQLSRQIVSLEDVIAPQSNPDIFQKSNINIIAS